MTPTEFRSALAALNLSQVGAARAWGVNPRTVRDWADMRGKGPPPPVPALLCEILLREFPSGHQMLVDRMANTNKRDAITKCTIE